MFNHDVVRKIVTECTIPLRKGPTVSNEALGGIQVMTINLMHSVNDAVEVNIDEVCTRVDCHFIEVAVHREKAEENKAAFIEQLDQWPTSFCDIANGPSYIAVGAELGDQGLAFQFMALGEVLGLWTVITPGKLGLDGKEADQAAGRGYIMFTGYRKDG